MNELPLITAHAGCMNTRLNSLESVLAGINAGADIVEVDVNVTKDRVAILFHDRYISLASQQRIALVDLTFQELQAITNIVSLEEALDIAMQSGITFNLDLKTFACVAPMAKVVKSRNMADQVLISGCDKENAARVKQLCPEFQILLNADQGVAACDQEQYERYIRQTCRDAIAAACCGINIDYKDCREAFLAYARLRCLPVLLYTIDDLAEMERFLRLGVHSITTNDVHALRSLKKGR
ncbi:glycerophosphoryl diester phosphodiesterase [Candidatus Vecturithrix granuli]|uniref:Glycerophosphoryl diester phosphodiesterase n=1 Tax=Vecturithrix granuli TaxID=1499967 RepID=A0A081C5K2_VECG1|nr:glycerophosphoryl diester phosphodiesterase [Candidatus Vecturithrix granuli]